MLGFKASGVDAFPADNPEEARKHLQEVLEGDYYFIDY